MKKIALKDLKYVKNIANDPTSSHNTPFRIIENRGYGMVVFLDDELKTRYKYLCDITPCDEHGNEVEIIE